MTTLQMLKLNKLIEKSATTQEPTAISIDGCTVDAKMKVGIVNAESGRLTVAVNGIEITTRNVYDGVILDQTKADILDRVALKIANIKLFGE